MIRLIAACSQRAVRPARLVLRAIVLAWLLAVGPALAAQQALLVGVSQLSAEPQENWLQAPRNDVRLMRDALLARGWAPDAIHTLADGVAGAGLPDLASIRAALRKLQASARAGDFVLLYFSGHGTRFVDAAKAYDEPDGLAEMFLARDGALHDTEIGEWIQALLARGAFVWTVFDTCSAASMTRGAPQLAPRSGPEDDPVIFRGLTPAQLSVAMQRAAGRDAPQAQPAASDDAAFVPAARYVAFFAAESHQRTPELRLPRSGSGASSHGLLTWALADALRSDAGTWRELFSQLLSQYPPVISELQDRFPGRELPSPVAEGALDVPLFQNAVRPASTLPSWPARRRGSAVEFDAGLLDGLVPGQPLQLTATLPDRTIRTQRVQLREVALGHGQAGLPAEWRALPPDTAWRVAVLSTPAEFALRVHAGAGVPGQVLGTLSLGYPASLQEVPAQDADLHLAVADGGFALTPASGGAPRFYNSASELRQALAEQAAQRWLQHVLQLAQRPEAAPLPGFEATLWTGGDAAASRSRPLAPGLAAPGPGAQVEISNASGRSVDLLLVGLTPEGGLLPIFPAALGQTNRFEQGSQRNPARKRFALPDRVSAAGGGLLVLATPARAHSVARFQGLSPRLEDDVLPDLVLRGAAPARRQAIHAVLSRW